MCNITSAVLNTLFSLGRSRGAVWNDAAVSNFNRKFHEILQQDRGYPGM